MCNFLSILGEVVSRYILSEFQSYFKIIKNSHNSKYLLFDKSHLKYNYVVQYNYVDW